MTTISLPGIDIAKNAFQLHGVDISGKVFRKERLARRELADFYPGISIVQPGWGSVSL